MAVTTVLGCSFLCVQKDFYWSLYSLSFNVSIVAIAMTTAMILCSSAANLAISLGMVGALSIVRFRSAIKDPRDLAFLLVDQRWTVGGYGCVFNRNCRQLFIAVMMFIFGKAVYSDCCYLLVLKGRQLQQPPRRKY
jgi:hypothetical protein